MAHSTQWHTVARLTCQVASDLHNAATKIMNSTETFLVTIHRFILATIVGEIKQANDS